MKTQLSKPVRSKANYTKEYKQQALELWRASGRSAAKSQGAALDKTHNLSMYPKQSATLPEFEDTASKVPYNPTSDPGY
jgi:hypothetical protein